MSKLYECHVCNDGTGNSTCFSCVLGLTGSSESKRYKRLVKKGLIEQGEVIKLGMKYRKENT